MYSLGDASSLPTGRTGAAIRKQAPVLVKNLKSVVDDQPLTASYDGYTSCPIVTRYGRMMLAEFDYDQQPKETFPFDQSKERWSMWGCLRNTACRLSTGTGCSREGCSQKMRMPCSKQPLL